MNCNETQKHCHPYLDQQLEAADRQHVDRHLSECSCCAKAYEAQRAFLGALKKLVHGCDATCAPQQFHARLRESLTGISKDLKPAERPVVTPNPVRILRMGPVMAMAASIMLGFGILMASQMMCITGECPIAIAAEHEHQRILAGAAPILAKDIDPDKLKQAIKEHMAEFPGLPSLCNCHLNPLNCGLVKVDGLPQGAFVQYAECNHEDDPVTLMVINTSAMSRAEVLNVRKKEFHFAMRSENCVLSWHSEKDGMLYVLVAHRPMKEALEIASLASR
jgi:hypothetical protein